jgi:hypothetical protein
MGAITPPSAPPKRASPLSKQCYPCLGMACSVDLTPITSPDDPRLAGMGHEEVAGADQIAQMLAATPRERLQCLADMLDFEERAHKARLLPREP